MEPRRIGTRREKPDDQRATLSLPTGFLDPRAYLAAVGRVHVAAFPGPRVREAVNQRVGKQSAERRFPPHPQRMGRHAVPPDLCRPRHGAYVQREIELQIQIVEELPRRRPVVFDA